MRFPKFFFQHLQLLRRKSCSVSSDLSFLVSLGIVFILATFASTVIPSIFGNAIERFLVGAGGFVVAVTYATFVYIDFKIVCFFSQLLPLVITRQK